MRMLKKIELNEIEEMRFLNSINELNNEGYSKKGYDVAFETYCISNFDENTFMNTYNSYVDFRNANPLEFLVIAKKTNGDLSKLCDIRDYFSKRDSRWHDEGEWLSRAEIEDYLRKDWLVYIVKSKNNLRIEKEIQSINEV